MTLLKMLTLNFHGNLSLAVIGNALSDQAQDE